MTSKNVDALFKDNKLSVITFNTADAHFAIPLEQVLYIEKDVKRNIQLNELDEFNHEVITFQNKTVQLHDFNQLVGSENHRQAMQKFVETMNTMEKQHRSWMQALEDSIAQEKPFEEALSADQCEFGKWYQNFRTDNEELQEVLNAFDKPHRDLHTNAGEILEMKQTDRGKALQALEMERGTTLNELLRLFDLARERAMSSVRPIILFVEHSGGKITALRLDNINDIVTYDRSHFCDDDSNEGLMKKKNEDFVVEGFLRNGNDAPLILINCKAKKLQAEMPA